MFIQYCENPDYKYTWCADNQATFFEKVIHFSTQYDISYLHFILNLQGKFAAQFAGGFVGRDIDLVDRDLKCECDEDKFITFHMILNGFTGLEMKTCNRLNGS